MPSKGVDVYSYISPALTPYSVHFSVPGSDLTRGADRNFTSDHLEVDYANLTGKLTYVGRFEFSVSRDGEAVASQYVDVNCLTGNMHDGTMMKAVHQQSIIKDDVIISYGFYDAGHGVAGLTSSDQCYVTVAPLSHSKWMGTLAPPGSPQAQQPFSRFALPAPHDDGMNSMEACEAVLHGRDENAVSELLKHIPHLTWLSEHLSNAAMAAMLPNIIYGVAITQKDPIPTLLALGARYFEFRPADMLPLFEDVHEALRKPHFQHACIPGLAFDDFLDQLVAFLAENADELVVVHFRWDNVVAECKRPTPEEIDAALTEACAKAAGDKPLTWGRGADCFTKPIDELRASGTRVVVVSEAAKYDSWTADAYRTLSADSIIARFESMDTAGQAASDITVLQCQATSQSIKEVLVYSVLAANADTSCLMSTKAKLDTTTLPWIRDNAVQRLGAEKLLVVMNDFLDGATTDVVIGLNRERLGGVGA